MESRERRGRPPADLLVCFPSRAHLTLMPKPICSPARPSEPINPHHPNKHHHHKKSKNKGANGATSPLLWAKTKPMGLDISEPTSPRVTCAGQIKVRPKSSSSSSKNWQSVMEEIERLHNSKKQKRRANWVEILGFKKDTMQYLLGCLRRVSFDFRCFGSFFASTDLTSDDEEHDDEEEEKGYRENQVGMEGIGENENSSTVFSKWFMVLQEEKNNRFTKEQKSKKTDKSHDNEESVIEECVPPSNSLLLMRCRSAPAKSWINEERQNEKEDEEKAEEGEKRSENLEMLLSYDTDFYKISTDIAKETWVVGGIRDQLSRSQSWKR